MEIHFSSDRRGYALKQQIIEYLTGLGYDCHDHGCFSQESADYPEFTPKAAKAVVSSADAFGVVFCGSGVGASMAANKVRGVRCVVAWCEHTAEYGRRHNHANVLAFGADLQTFTQVKRCLDAYIAAEPEGDRHARRVGMLNEMDSARIDAAGDR